MKIVFGDWGIAGSVAEFGLGSTATSKAWSGSKGWHIR